jgi:hypothetical protein
MDVDDEFGLAVDDDDAGDAAPSSTSALAAGGSTAGEAPTPPVEEAAAAAPATAPASAHPRTPPPRPLASFLRSLYTLCCDSDEDVVTWAKAGASFVIKDMPRFCADVLPAYFRHSNFSSFSRQLNFYS